MEFGILGLELSGKTTLFSLLTGHEPLAGHGKSAVHVGIAQVPGPSARPPLRALQAEEAHPGHGAVRGRAGDRQGRLGEPERPRAAEHGRARGRGPWVRLRRRAPPRGSLDPARDLELVETELLLNDLSVAGNRLERLGRDLAKRRTAELEAEKDALERCRAALEAGTPLRRVDLTGDERRLLKGFAFLTLKPMLVVLNVGEADAADLAGAVERSGLSVFQSQPAWRSARCAPRSSRRSRASLPPTRPPFFPTSGCRTARSTGSCARHISCWA